jgi:hypothetical protein
MGAASIRHSLHPLMSEGLVRNSSGADRAARMYCYESIGQAYKLGVIPGRPNGSARSAAR